MPIILDQPVILAGNTSRDDVLLSLFANFSAQSGGALISEEALNAMKDAAIEREHTSSTFLGRGLAVPHGRTEQLSEIHIAVGISEEGICWPDTENTAHLILLLGVPAVMIRDYLLLMQKILRWHKDTATIDASGKVKDPGKLIQELKDLVA